MASSDGTGKYSKCSEGECGVTLWGLTAWNHGDACGFAALSRSTRSVCSAITRQVFPVVLDTDSPAFRAGLERMRKIAARIDDAKAQGGVIGAVKRVALTGAAALAFARLYLTPVQRNTIPVSARLAPVW